MANIDNRQHKYLGQPRSSPFSSWDETDRDKTRRARVLDFLLLYVTLLAFIDIPRLSGHSIFHHFLLILVWKILPISSNDNIGIDRQDLPRSHPETRHVVSEHDLLGRWIFYHCMTGICRLPIYPRVSEHPPYTPFLSSVKVKHIVNIANRQHRYLGQGRSPRSHLETRQIVSKHDVPGCWIFYYYMSHI